MIKTAIKHYIIEKCIDTALTKIDTLGEPTYNLVVINKHGELAVLYVHSDGTRYMSLLYDQIINHSIRLGQLPATTSMTSMHKSHMETKETLIKGTYNLYIISYGGAIIEVNTPLYDIIRDAYDKYSN